MVTDVYNTGKGYAFVTYDRKEDAVTVSGWFRFRLRIGTVVCLKSAPNRTWITFN